MASKAAPAADASANAGEAKLHAEANVDKAPATEAELQVVAPATKDKAGDALALAKEDEKAADTVSSADQVASGGGSAAGAAAADIPLLTKQALQQHDVEQSQDLASVVSSTTAADNFQFSDGQAYSFRAALSRKTECSMKPGGSEQPTTTSVIDESGSVVSIEDQCRACSLKKVKGVPILPLPQTWLPECLQRCHEARQDWQLRQPDSGRCLSTHFWNRQRGPAGFGAQQQSHLGHMRAQWIHR